MSYFRRFVHNFFVHPLMVLLPENLGNKIHDTNGEWAFGKPSMSDYCPTFYFGEGKTLLTKDTRSIMHKGCIEITHVIILTNPLPETQINKGMGDYVFGEEAKAYFNDQVAQGLATILSFKDKELRDTVYDSFFTTVGGNRAHD